jgi:hypothetical protein
MGAGFPGISFVINDLERDGDPNWSHRSALEFAAGWLHCTRYLDFLPFVSAYSQHDQPSDDE